MGQGGREFSFQSYFLPIAVSDFFRAELLLFNYLIGVMGILFTDQFIKLIIILKNVFA